jgi:cytochrome c peroxidase
MVENNRRFVLEASALALAPAVGTSWAQGTGSLTSIEDLGKQLFFDTNLSVNKTQSRATCHAPSTGFTGPDSQVNRTGSVYQGALPDHFGNRKPPTAAYGGASPVMYFAAAESLWIGGMFWDGRTTGWILGDPLAEQAQDPFLNPVEQALPNAKTATWG